MQAFNHWFDGLPSGRRAFLFIMIMFGWLVPMTVKDDGTTLVFTLYIFGAVWMVLAAGFGLSRLPENTK